MSTDTPTEQQRHLYIKTHPPATPSDAIPTFEALHHYELRSKPSPHADLHIHHHLPLFPAIASRSRASMGSVLPHVLHRAPVVLYTLMIHAGGVRSCDSGVSQVWGAAYVSDSFRLGKEMNEYDGEGEVDFGGDGERGGGDGTYTFIQAAEFENI